jgi:nucleoside-diphosphate-sugar epimerase
MKALVTGAGGFLGRYVTEQLIARGDEVRTFARGDYPELVELGAEHVRGDVADADSVADACAGIECVIHTAAKPGIWGSWNRYYETNTVGTQNIIAGCRQHHVGRLVFSSSPSVTFDGVEQNGIDETAPYARRWLCHYPHTKALAEQFVLKENKDGLTTCALRPHLIWGPRDGHLVPRLIERARSGKLRRVGDGTNLVDMIYVENAAEAHLQAADALAAQPEVVGGRAYFLSQDEPVNCWDWIDELLALAKLPPLKKSISYKAAWRVGAAMEAIYGVLGVSAEPRMTRFLAAQLATSHHFDVSAAKRDLGYAPRVSTAAGMQRLGEWLNSTS